MYHWEVRNDRSRGAYCYSIHVSDVGVCPHEMIHGQHHWKGICKKVCSSSGCDVVCVRSKVKITPTCPSPYLFNTTRRVLAIPMPQEHKIALEGNLTKCVQWHGIVLEHNGGARRYDTLPALDVTQITSDGSTSFQLEVRVLGLVVQVGTREHVEVKRV